jgi:hypothetical protein
LLKDYGLLRGGILDAKNLVGNERSRVYKDIVFHAGLV